jgi:hypothetical protein
VGTCFTHRRSEKCVRIFIGKLKRRDYAEDPGVDEKIILE